jgi:integrase
MSKRPSLTYQVTTVLGVAFNEGYGRSRHADKRNALNNNKPIDTYTKDKIYSRNTYNSTRKTCVSFTNFCKEEYGVRYLQDIKPEMFEKFIERGSIFGKAYEENTAAAYFSQVKKLENAFSTSTGMKAEFANKDYMKHTDENVQVKGRMPSDIHDRIIEKAYEQKFETGLAFDVARSLGLRASEISNLRKEDFKFKDEKLESVHIHRSKGGRNRDIESKRLSESQIETVTKVYEHFKDKLQDHDRLFINKPASYETAFARTRDSITGDDKYKGSGIHSMRKEFAQDYFNRELKRMFEDRAADIEKEPERKREIENDIEKEVKKELTEVLGHDRLEVLKSYLE